MAPVPATTKGLNGIPLSSVSPGIALAGCFQILLAGMALTGGLIFLRQRRRRNGARLAAQRAPPLLDDTSLTQSTVRTPVLATLLGRERTVPQDDSFDDISALLHPDSEDSLPPLPLPPTPSTHSRFFHRIHCLFRFPALLCGSPPSSATAQTVSRDDQPFGQHTLARPPSRRSGDYQATMGTEVPRIVVTPPYEETDPESTVSSPASVCSDLDSPSLMTPPLKSRPHVRVYDESVGDVPGSFLSMDIADDALDPTAECGRARAGLPSKPAVSRDGLGLTGLSTCATPQSSNGPPHSEAKVSPGLSGVRQEPRVTIVAAADLGYTPIREFALNGPADIVDPAAHDTDTQDHALTPTDSDPDGDPDGEGWEVRLVGAFASSPSGDSVGQREDGSGEERERKEVGARCEDLHRVMAERRPRVCSVGSSFTAEVSEWSVWSLESGFAAHKAVDGRPYSTSSGMTLFADEDEDEDGERPLSLSYALAGPVLRCARS